MVPAVPSVEVATFQTAGGSIAYSELEAMPTIELVFAFTTAASDDVAVVTVELVFAFTSVTTDDDAF